MAESNAPENKDRGLFGLFGKKKEDETHQQHASGVDPHGHVVEPKHHGEGEKKPHEGGLMGKLHRSNSSSSSSSSDEEGGEKGEKKKKKKGGLKEKVAGHKKGGEEHGEKKEGLMEKIKEKLPGHHSKEEEHKGR